MLVLKNTMLAIALVAGISGAFATKVANSPKVDEPRYDWNGSGPLYSGTLDDKTIMEAQDAYGCKGQTIKCAAGEISSGVGAPKATIFLND
ncbi:hypothetical protein HDE69_005188 [Pedobacter cryoconitis]|uniref:Pectate lyase n=1 Tax=Pedobacter cryoconitis TaxID=188932 RepID=A0A7W8YYE5_9SPHI|nr:hypothetical protein [Pedobacter cryoconitis]MBB5624091.1 hypothetical protein [Pedobacter cryoconitis]MBB5644907.1 hypothetical protein [Pedobacter cryoconitis]